jgi:hypothetical protein
MKIRQVFGVFTVADPQTLLEEKVSTEAKLALAEYDLRLAQEDVARLTLELQKQKESSPQDANGLFFSASCFIIYVVIDLSVVGKFFVHISIP